MTEKKLIIVLVAVSLLLVGGGVFVLTATNTPQITSSARAKAYVPDSTSFDWGTIPMYKGNATKSFTIKNTGTEVLKLYNVKTSCHCTKAYMTISGEESPTFGMDSYSSWTGKIIPGTEGKLTVVFDPAFHGPTGVGPINRFVSVETNDRANSKLTFTVTGTVVK